MEQLGLIAPKFILPHGIDLLNFFMMPERGLLRRKLQIPKDAFVLLFLGRLVHIKRPDIAIDTLAHIRGNGINAQLELLDQMKRDWSKLYE